MTDHATDRLFSCRHEAVVFPVSRLVCDVERFRRDEDEPMSQKGMGAVYVSAHDGSALRSLRPGEREEILARYYDAHHRRLEEQTARRLDAFGRCLIVDCHSFYPEPLPHEPDQTPNRPDVCIGTDPYHTPPALAEAAANEFRARGYSVALNSPFAGALVPLRYYRRDMRVISVMIEVNRALYLDGTRPGGRFGRVRCDVCAAIERMLDGICVTDCAR